MSDRLISLFEKMASGFSKLFMMEGTNSRSKEKNLSSPGIDRGWMASKQREQFAYPCNVQGRQIQDWGCSSVVEHFRGGEGKEGRRREEEGGGREE